MSEYEKRRVPEICTICGGVIDRTQSFMLLKIKIGRYRKYHSFHKLCYELIQTKTSEVSSNALAPEPLEED